MSSRCRIALMTGTHAGAIGVFGVGGDATAVAVIGAIVVVARDRAAIVPPPALTRPRLILGLDAATNLLITTMNAEPAEPAGEDALGGLRVDPHPCAEAV